MRKPIGQHLVERAVQLLHPLAAAVGRRPHGVQAYRQRQNRTESGLFRDSCSWRTAGSPRTSSRRTQCGRGTVPRPTAAPSGARRQEGPATGGRIPPQSADNAKTGLNRDFFGTVARPGAPPHRRARSRRTRCCPNSSADPSMARSAPRRARSNGLRPCRRRATPAPRDSSPGAISLARGHSSLRSALCRASSAAVIKR